MPSVHWHSYNTNEGFIGALDIWYYVMGLIFNPDGSDFVAFSRLKYVDKTELIAYTNCVMETGQNLVSKIVREFA